MNPHARSTCRTTMTARIPAQLCCYGADSALRFGRFYLIVLINVFFKKSYILKISFSSLKECKTKIISEIIYRVTLVVWH